MIAQRKVLGIVPARGQSKRVPRKNLQKIGGKTLMEWTIDEAKKSKFIDTLVVSSEDEEILSEAKRCGVVNLVQRPQALAKDDSSSADVVLHVLEQYRDYDFLVLLQPTSPLRTAHDIDQAINKFYRENHSFLVSVAEGGVLNGAVYVANVSAFQKAKAFTGDAMGYYEMPLERSLDIDTPEDLERFRAYIARRVGE